MNAIQEQREKVAAEINKLESMGGKAKQFRDSTFARFPIVFMFMTTFGLVATLYGFEKIIDEVQFFSENPRMVLVAGIATLALSGTLYNKLM